MPRRDSSITTPPKPCPNVDCGEDDDLEVRGVQSYMHVVCRACAMRGPGADAKSGAIEMWNELPRAE